MFANITISQQYTNFYQCIFPVAESVRVEDKEKWWVEASFFQWKLFSFVEGGRDVKVCVFCVFAEAQEPYAIAVLLHNDLVVIDLLSPGFPCFENPYPMDLHEAAVTCCTYLADCPSDLIPAFYSVGSRAHKRAGLSEREWPICGGEWSPTSCSYNEIILTGYGTTQILFFLQKSLSAARTLKMS